MHENLKVDDPLTFFYQLVMVVDSRDPLFYRCPDLEVRLSFFHKELVAKC